MYVRRVGGVEVVPHRSAGFGREESRSGLGSRQARRVGGQVGGGRGVIRGGDASIPRVLSTQGFPPRHGGSMVLGRGQRLADWSHAPLMFPAVADLGRGLVVGKESRRCAARPGPHPGTQVRSRAVGQTKEGRRSGAMRRPCPGVDPGSPTGWGVVYVRGRVADADMTAVARRHQKMRKRVRPVELHPPSEPVVRRGCQPQSPAGRCLGVPLNDVRQVRVFAAARGAFSRVGQSLARTRTVSWGGGHASSPWFKFCGRRP